MREEEEINLDWVWVDFLENEIDPKLKPDLKDLLKLSKESRKTLMDYHWLREMIVTTDPAHEEYLANWDQSKTMNDIMETCKEIDRSKVKSKSLNSRY